MLLRYSSQTVLVVTGRMFNYILLYYFYNKDVVCCFHIYTIIYAYFGSKTLHVLLD